jgi:hypothetical protein
VASSDLFDVFVHLPAREISIAPSARGKYFNHLNFQQLNYIYTSESMAMTKAHKEIAYFMVQLAQNAATSERQVIQSVAAKTNELLEQLM